MYDDRPSWEQNKTKSTTFNTGCKPAMTAHSPSPTYNWYFIEQKKRVQGEFNEIDLGDIRAAIAGVKNHWKKYVDANLKFFTDFTEHASRGEKDKIDCAWREICKIKQAGKVHP